MAKATPFESDIDRAHAILDDAVKGMNAADTILTHHSKGDARLDTVNFPVEEGLVRETIALLDKWKIQAAALVRALDTATASAGLQFERLFDENAGREKSGFFSRRIHLGHGNPVSIAADLRTLLSASARLNAVLTSARPVLVRHARSAEDHLLRIIERRRRADFDIEEAQRHADALLPRIADRKSRLGSARNAAALASFQEELRAFITEREARQEKERALLPERQTLQRLIAIYEEFVEALNAQIAALNVMGAKLTLDIEQRIALLKASEAQQSDASLPTVTPQAAELIAAFEANVLAGHDLAQRRARADAAFARRLEPAPAPTPPAGADMPPPSSEADAAPAKNPDPSLP